MKMLNNHNGKIQIPGGGPGRFGKVEGIFHEQNFVATKQRFT